MMSAIKSFRDFPVNRQRLAIVMICLLLASCTNRYTDLTSSLSPRILDVPDGKYNHVAWIKDDSIAVAYSQKQPPSSGDFTIGLYSIRAKTWQILKGVPQEICDAGRVAWLNVLSNGELGFIVECHNLGQGNEIINFLYGWDALANRLRELRRYKPNEPYFRTADYTFSPDMSQLIQARIDARAFSVDVDGRFTPILTDYNLVESPRWSPDGKVLAFAASAASDVLTTSPWDIYLKRAGREPPQKVLSDVQFASFVKWSPLGRWLSIRGKYQSQDGIWVLDTETSQLMRVWNDQSFYDWSPDGKHMVVIERTKRLEVDGEERTRPVIIDLSPLVYQTTP